MSNPTCVQCGAVLVGALFGTGLRCPDYQQHRDEVPTFSKTELRRRIRAGKALLGPSYRHLKTEIGVRVRAEEQAVIGRVPVGTDIWMENDDLSDFTTVDDYDDLRQGQIIHLYMSERYGFGDHWELYDTRVIWIGDADHEPVLLD